MYVVGMVLLAMGIMLLIPCGIAVGNAKDLDEAIGFLVCTGAIPVPMIVLGIYLIRRAEARSALERGADERADPPHDEPGDPVGRVMSRALAFDLSRLNWVGWLLFFATLGFVGAEVVVVGLLVGNGQWANGGPPRIIGLPLVLLALAFFAGLRWFLRLLGVSIYRR